MSKNIIGKTYDEIIPQIKKEVSSLKNRFNASSWKAKTAIGAAVVAFGYASFGFAPEGIATEMVLAAQALSLIGFSTSYLGQRLDYNKHYMVMHGLGASLVSASSFMLDSPSYGIMMGFASARFLTMAAVASEKEDITKRVVLAATFAAAGAGTMFALDAFQSNWDYLNLAAMMLATASNVMPSGDKYDLSHYSRFLISKAAALNVIYQVAHGRNIPAMIFEGLSVINKYDVMNEKDVPNIDKDGNALSTTQKWRHYFASGLDKNKLLEDGMKIEHIGKDHD